MSTCLRAVQLEIGPFLSSARDRKFLIFAQGRGGALASTDEAPVTNESSVTQNRKKRKISDALVESPMTHFRRVLMQSNDLAAG